MNCHGKKSVLAEIHHFRVTETVSPTINTRTLIDHKYFMMSTVKFIDPQVSLVNHKKKRSLNKTNIYK